MTPCPPRWSAWIALLLLLLRPGTLPAQNPPPDLEAREIHACRRNLSVIFEAIQAYRRVHQDIPNALWELQPRFLAENRFLFCPTARRLGLTSGDMVKWGGSARTSYGYEFSPEPIPREISGGSARTMREWKQLQMGLVGSEVPIVRCHTHERAVLNLSFGGRIYECRALEWEEEFRELVDPRDLTHARLLAAHTVVKKIIVPRRDPGAGPGQIDLGDCYNGSLAGSGWPWDSPPGPLAALPVGLARLQDTAFDVRGVVQLGALRPGLIPYPAAVTNIQIGTPARRVHLLGATADVDAPDSVVATCLFHFEDGRQHSWRLRYGRHLAACVADPRAPAGPAPAWSAELAGGRSARLFHVVWTNPAPGRVLQRMEFTCDKGAAGPFLVALTADPEP